jgi:hypothetical protein
MEPIRIKINYQGKIFDTVITKVPCKKRFGKLYLIATLTTSKDGALVNLYESKRLLNTMLIKF